MKLINSPVPIYGDTSWRGACPLEEVEQITFFNWLRRSYPRSHGVLAYHPKNEQQLRGGQYGALVKTRAMGMTKGASDIIIPGSPTFVCEIKRQDHTKSTWQDGQIEYLAAAMDAGCFACVALGYIGAREAFIKWAESTYG